MSYDLSPEALAAIHETMTALHQAGIIDDRTMRRFDEDCLVPDDHPNLKSDPEPHAPHPTPKP